jgi:hypothetical protein
VPDVFSRRIPFLTALAALAALTALSFVPVASAKTCAEQVIDDWYGNGRVDQIFPKHCYLEAIRSLPVDVKDYSNAEEDIRRALAFAGQGEPDPGPSGGPAPTGTNGEDPPGTTPTSPTTPPDETSGTGEQTIAGGGVDTSGPSSLPIPLLVLGGLALLLLAAGGAGYLSRRAQARRNGGPPGPA